MAKNTGKVREKSGNFVSPEKWEPWSIGVAWDALHDIFWIFECITTRLFVPIVQMSNKIPEFLQQCVC